MTSIASKRFADVTVGEVLPSFTVPLTLTGIAAAAIATRDYQPVHHDPIRAQSHGTEQVFMSTHSTAGYFERLVIEWTGPGAFLKSLKFRMGLPNVAGDTMIASGTVTACNPEDQSVEIAVDITNSKGSHANGTAAVRFL